MRANRFVLDTNILISYFITKNENRLLDFVTENKISLYVCNELLNEIEKVLGYSHLKKYGINIRESLHFVKRIGVQFQLTYPIKNYLLSDTDDNYIIALALQTNSGYVTSGDKHILNEKNRLEKKYPKLHIITKTEFEKMFSEN